MEITCDISHLHDIKEFAKFGVTLTPVVIINDKIVISGKVPIKEEIKKILEKL